MRQWAWAYFKREGGSPLITEHQQKETGEKRLAE